MREIDLAIIGAGVAGLTAATEAARAGVSVLVIERLGAGGQVLTVDNIDNFPGHPEGISGYELGPLLQEQAEAAGVSFTLDTVEAIGGGADRRHWLRCTGDTIAARAVLVAAGSARRQLGVPGEGPLQGRGVSHCASCDGPLFRNVPLCVVGGGDSAFGEALVLAPYASRLTLVFREDQAHAQAHLVRALTALDHVELVAGAQVIEITGGGEAVGVTGLVLRQGDLPVRHVPAAGVFVYAGLQAQSAFLGDALRLDANGRIETDAALCSSVPGIFAAGDIRAGADYRLAAAAADGAAAALSACRYLKHAAS